MKRAFGFALVTWLGIASSAFAGSLITKEFPIDENGKGNNARYFEWNVAESTTHKIALAMTGHQAARSKTPFYIFDLDGTRLNKIFLQGFVRAVRPISNGRFAVATWNSFVIMDDHANLLKSTPTACEAQSGEEAIPAPDIIQTMDGSLFLNCYGQVSSRHSFYFFSESGDLKAEYSPTPDDFNNTTAYVKSAVETSPNEISTVLMDLKTQKLLINDYDSNGNQIRQHSLPAEPRLLYAKGWQAADGGRGDLLLGYYPSRRTPRCEISRLHDGGMSAPVNCYGSPRESLGNKSFYFNSVPYLNGLRLALVTSDNGFEIPYFQVMDSNAEIVEKSAKLDIVWGADAARHAKPAVTSNGLIFISYEGRSVNEARIYDSKFNLLAKTAVATPSNYISRPILLSNGAFAFAGDSSLILARYQP